MNKVINIEDHMKYKVKKLINMDFRPSEIATMLDKPIEKIHRWMI